MWVSGMNVIDSNWSILSKTFKNIWNYSLLKFLQLLPMWTVPRVDSFFPARAPCSGCNFCRNWSELALNIAPTPTNQACMPINRNLDSILWQISWILSPNLKYRGFIALNPINCNQNFFFGKFQKNPEQNLRPNKPIKLSVFIGFLLDFYWFIGFSNLHQNFQNWSKTMKKPSESSKPWIFLEFWLARPRWM